MQQEKVMMMKKILKNLMKMKLQDLFRPNQLRNSNSKSRQKNNQKKIQTMMKRRRKKKTLRKNQTMFIKPQKVMKTMKMKMMMKILIYQVKKKILMKRKKVMMISKWIFKPFQIKRKERLLKTVYRRAYNNQLKSKTLDKTRLNRRSLSNRLNRIRTSLNSNNKSRVTHNQRIRKRETRRRIRTRIEIELFEIN